MNVQVIDGANGFVGSHLIGALLARGDEVIALARASPEVVRRRVADALLCLGFEESLAGRLRVRGLALDGPDLGLPVAEVFADAAPTGTPPRSSPSSHAARRNS